jgi:hypothetical protein
MEFVFKFSKYFIKTMENTIGGVTVRVILGSY